MTDEIIIQAGQYWQALVAVKNHEIAKGDVLLVQSVRDVDKTAHTIILRPHPRWYAENPRCDAEIRFLAAEFFEKFIYCPGWKEIRMAELAEVQGRVSQLQLELADASRDPKVMEEFVQKGLKKWAKEQKLLPGTLAALPDVTPNMALSTNLTTEKVETMKLGMAKVQQTAALQAEYIKDKVDEIGKTVQAMTPFYQEQAAAALATTEDVMTHVGKLMTGVQSLDLYVGKDVHVQTLRKGKSASEEEPLAIMQRKLFMDEELSAWADVEAEFDFESVDKFYKALAASPNLVKQIFATERCIVCVAVTERDLDYGNAWENAQKKEINKRVFLLVRDGENLHVIHSPVESHMKSPRLFPSAKDVEDIFREHRWFNEDEGKLITFNDVKYTDKLSDHEALAVHYKRFLILLAGLDHRENLFGTFYEGPKDMKFISMEFQQKHMRFIYDDDAAHMLPEEKRPDFMDWAAEKNAYLQSGSRVICKWNDVGNSDTAPAIYKPASYRSTSDRDRQMATPLNNFDVVIAFRDGKDIFAKCAVERYAYSSGEEKKFDAKVNLSKYKRWGSYSVGFLCLDAVKADELEYYVYNRTNRRNFLSYIRLFKIAVAHLREEEKAEVTTRTKLRKALREGGIENRNDAIDKAVIAWRAAHRGEALARASDAVEFPRLLNHIWSITQGDQTWKEAETWAEKQGLTPLRLAQSGKAQTLVLYCAPLPDEVDDRLFPHAWVHAIGLIRTKNGLKQTSRTWKLLAKNNASQTILRDWPEIETWADRYSPVIRFEEKHAAFERVKDFANQSTVLKPMLDSIWDVIYSQWSEMRNHMMRTGRRGYVENPRLMVPFGLRLRKNKLQFIAVGVYDAAGLLYANAPDAERKAKIVKLYSEIYRDKSSAVERISGEHDYRMKLRVFKVSIDSDIRPNGFADFSGDSLGSEGEFELDELPKIMKKIIKYEEKHGKESKFYVPGVTD